jgi:2-hydroxychromene-2-carboxylate isomerase
MSEFDRRAEDLSVDHADVVNHYRSAHAIAVQHARQGASTEDLRQAVVHYRALFDDLLEVREPERRRA